MARDLVRDHDCDYPNCHAKARWKDGSAYLCREHMAGLREMRKQEAVTAWRNRQLERDAPRRCRYCREPIEESEPVDGQPVWVLRDGASRVWCRESVRGWHRPADPPRINHHWTPDMAEIARNIGQMQDAIRAAGIAGQRARQAAEQLDAQVRMTPAGNTPLGDHQCIICGERRRTLDHLDLHMSVSHSHRRPRSLDDGPEGIGIPPAPYDCPSCGIRYITRAARNSHVQAAHPPYRYGCLGCGDRFLTVADLDDHMQNSHVA